MKLRIGLAFLIGAVCGASLAVERERREDMRALDTRVTALEEAVASYSYPRPPAPISPLITASPCSVYPGGSLILTMPGIAIGGDPTEHCAAILMENGKAVGSMTGDGRIIWKGQEIR